MTDTHVTAASLQPPSTLMTTVRREERHLGLTKITEIGLLSTVTKNERLLKELGMVSPENKGFI